MNKKITYSLIAASLFVFLLVTACTAHQEQVPRTEPDTQAVKALPDSTPLPKVTTAPVEKVVIGAVGDIMVMPRQISEAYDADYNTYDFSKTFDGVATMFSQADLMCGNFECCFAGEAAGYSNGNPNPMGLMRFNAPDAFLDALTGAGFDCLTTANNHAADCGVDGLLRTIETIQSAGILQTGTFRQAADREAVTMTEINGIKIGILAATRWINDYTALKNDEKSAYFSRLSDMAAIRQEIQRCRDAGAEFIVMFVHWDYEYKSLPEGGTRKYAAELLKAGVDAVIGSHPHVVQPFEYITVEREDGSEYTGLVAYSLGNFLANMTGERTYGIYLQLTVWRESDGAVRLTEASYMPTICFRHEYPSEVPNFHQLLPALENPLAEHVAGGLTEHEKAVIIKARKYVLSVCGESVVPLMADTDWILQRRTAVNGVFWHKGQAVRE